MATPKISKEEAAVRKALAAVQADTGLARAQEIIKTGAVPAATATAKPTYEESKSLVSQISDPKIRAEFEKAYAGIDTQQQKVITQAGILGYNVDTNTGALTPIQQNQNQIQIQQQQIQQQQQQIQTTAVNLAEQEFINTLKLLMGSTEASKPYVKQLYALTSKYYKTGSSVADAVNLALYDAQENKLIPEFTNRFSGIFKIQARRAAGEIIDVPTLSEYIKSQEGIADVLRRTGLGELANETFLNEVMGTGKSVTETTKVITDVFDAIKLAPKEWRDMVNTKMPFASDVDLAKGLLLGAEGAADLERKVNKYGIMAAGQSQGLQVSEATAGELLAKGQGYTSSKPKFGQAAAITIGAQKLTSMETGVEPGKAYTQEQAFSAVFDQNYQALQNIQNLSEREGARFAGKSGRFASKDRAAGQI
jgi:hypothetical protein